MKPWQSASIGIGGIVLGLLGCAAWVSYARFEEPSLAPYRGQTTRFTSHGAFDASVDKCLDSFAGKEPFHAVAYVRDGANKAMRAPQERDGMTLTELKSQVHAWLKVPDSGAAAVIVGTRLGPENGPNASLAWIRGRGVIARSDRGFSLQGAVEELQSDKK